MHTFLLFSLVYLLAIISPGPDFFLITRNTLLYSRKIAVYTALGVAVGASVHLSYCIFGLRLLADYSENLINIVKYAGGSYLIYLGLKGLLRRGDLPKQKGLHHVALIPHRKAFKQGFFCNLLNPKAALFFISTFSLLAQQYTPVTVQVLYALEVVLLTFAWFSGLAFLFTIPAIKQRLNLIQPILIKILSVLLIFFGGYLFAL